jgi:hypothetical protein
MAKYGASFQAFATTTAIKTLLKITGIAAKPYEIVELGMYGAGSVAPADIQHEASACFVSAAGAGTGTAQTAEKMRQSSAAASSTVLVNLTVEPTTYSAVFPVQFGFNQRGGMRWAVPQGEGMANQFENTSMHAGWRVKSSAVGTVDGMANWWEM